MRKLLYLPTMIAQKLLVILCLLSPLATHAQNAILDSDEAIQDAQDAALEVDPNALSREGQVMDQDPYESQSEVLSIHYESLRLTPVEESNLKLVGRGVYKNKTKEQIFATCANEACDQLRFIYHSQTEGTFYLGSNVPVTGHSNSVNKNRKRTLQKVLKEFKSWRETSNKEHPYRAGAIKGLLGMGGSIGLGYQLVAWGASGLTATYLVVPLAVTLTACIRGLTLGNGKVSTSLRDNNTWNWSESPKRIRARTFDELHEYLSQHQK